MITIKTKKDIKIIAEGGRKLSEIFDLVKERVKAGVSTFELDAYADFLIKRAGGKPSFKMVPRYKYATCFCVNECIVHGLPQKEVLKEGDVLGIDIGMFYKGFHTDMAETIVISDKNSKDEKVIKFLNIGKLALKKAIEKSISSSYIGQISQVIQEIIEREGYSIVKELVGHGIGKYLHEDPQIPGFLKGKIENTPVLKPGMVIAIEVIYNMGKPEISYQKDGWTIISQDKSLSGLFEATIAITDKKPLVLTKV